MKEVIFMKKGKTVAVILIILSSLVLAWNILRPTILIICVFIMAKVIPWFKNVFFGSKFIPESSMGIIGGQDGPTAFLYVSSASDDVITIVSTVLSLAVLIISIVYLVRNRKKNI